MDDAGKQRFAGTRPDEQAAAGDPGLAPDVGHGEDLDSAANADALEQDPDEVPNRIQEPEPPREERVGPE
jgi:hypothetical protein